MFVYVAEVTTMQLLIVVTIERTNVYMFHRFFVAYSMLIQTRAVLSHGGPRDAGVHAAVISITYRIFLRRHRAVSLPQHAFLVGLSADCSKLSVKK